MVAGFRTVKPFTLQTKGEMPRQMPTASSVPARCVAMACRAAACFICYSMQAGSISCKDLTQECPPFLCDRDTAIIPDDGCCPICSTGKKENFIEKL